MLCLFLCLHYTHFWQCLFCFFFSFKLRWKFVYKWSRRSYFSRWNECTVNNIMIINIYIKRNPIGMDTFFFCSSSLKTRHNITLKWCQFETNNNNSFLMTFLLLPNSMRKKNWITAFDAIVSLQSTMLNRWKRNRKCRNLLGNVE